MLVHKTGEDSTKYPTVHRTVPDNKVLSNPPMSTVPRLRTPELNKSMLMLNDDSIKAGLGVKWVRVARRSE